jgi:hypothetical protein
VFRRKAVENKRRIGQETVNNCGISVTRPSRACSKWAVGQAARKYEWGLNVEPVSGYFY